MICASCRRAGNLNSQVEPGMPNAEKLIKAMHRDCDGGNWCDCQHVVGQALNLTLINEGKSAAEPEEAEADVLEPVE